MSGYTPVFREIYMGTLYGRWPAAAVWASLLPLCDKNGHIDMSPQAISGMTGWPLDLLHEGIRQLMEPDPSSRTPDDDGRRLVLIDPSRPWGWRAVNHGKYRERARKQAWDAERTASGRDAERKRAERGAAVTGGERPSRRVPTRPDASRESPLSDTDTDTDYGEQLRSTSERSFRPSSSERARADGTISKREFRRRQFKAAVADLADQKAIP